MNFRATCHTASIAAKRCAVPLVTGVAVAFFFWVPGGFTQQQLDSEAVINHLNAVIKLYRNASAELQTGGAPTDVIYQENAKSFAAEVVRLAFQAARAEAAAIRATEKGGAPNSSSAQSSAQTEARYKARIADLQSRLDNINKQIASAPKSKRDALVAQKQALEGELNLDNAVLEVIQKRAAFMENGNDTAGEGLEGRINQLAHSVPGVFAVTNDQKPGTQAKPTPQSEATKQNPSGLASQALALYAAITSVHQIDQLNEQSASVKQMVNDLR